MSTAKPPGAPQARFSIISGELTLLYPPEFQVEDPFGPTKPYRTFYGAPTERTQGHCYPAIMSVGAGDPLIRYEDAASKHYTPNPPTGGIVLQEILPSCLTKKTSTDEDLMNLVAGPASMEGFTPVSQIVDYKLSGHQIFFAAAQAFSKDVDSIRRPSVGMTLVAMVCMKYKERILLWTVTANDAVILNQLLAVRIQFGTDAPWPLVPFKLASTDVKPDKNNQPR